MNEEDYLNLRLCDPLISEGGEWDVNLINCFIVEDVVLRVRSIFFGNDLISDGYY